MPSYQQLPRPRPWLVCVERHCVHRARHMVALRSPGKRRPPLDECDIHSARAQAGKAGVQSFRRLPARQASTATGAGRSRAFSASVGSERGSHGFGNIGMRDLHRQRMHPGIGPPGRRRSYRCPFAGDASPGWLLPAPAAPTVHARCRCQPDERTVPSYSMVKFEAGQLGEPSDLAFRPGFVSDSSSAFARA